jgi:hypothetical protein
MHHVIDMNIIQRKALYVHGLFMSRAELIKVNFY